MGRYRALVNGPSVIMAHGPTGALDTRPGEEIRALFQRLNCDGPEDGTMVALVTHETDIALRARRVVRFKDGHVVSDESLLRPVNAEEALTRMVSPEEEFANA